MNKHSSIGLVSSRTEKQYLKPFSLLILLTLIFSTLSANVAASSVLTKLIELTKTNSKDDNIELFFEELNFDFQASGSKYIKLKAKSISDDATLVLRRRKSQMYFMVIAENAGFENFDIKDLEAVVLSNIESTAVDINVTHNAEYSIRDMKGLRLDIDAKVSNNKMSFSYWIYEHNGFIYQLVSWATRKNIKQLHNEFNQLIEGFSLRSDTRIAVLEGKELLKSFKSPLGFEIDTKGTGWLVWKDLKEDHPLAEIGAELGSHGFFLVTPFCYGDNKPHDNAIKSALFHKLGIDYPNPKMTIGAEVALGELTAETLKYVWDIDETLHSARFSTIISDECSFLLSVWSVLENDGVDEHNERFLSKIKFKNIQYEKIKSKLNQNNLANLFNSTGLYYYNAENYTESLKYFKLAHDKSNDNENYVNNIFDAYNKLGKKQKAIDFFLENKKNITLTTELDAWLAWFYEEEGQMKKAISHYGAAFSKGYKNDSELGRYVDLLIENEQLELAESVAKKFVEKKEGVFILRKRAAIKRKMKKHSEAFELLSQAQSGRPLVEDLVFDKIYLHTDLGENEQIVELANSLIDIGNASAGAFYQRGVAEYNLSWYMQSKKSFEKALTFSPDNDNIKEYLSVVSGLLGEGESTSISIPIKEVKITANIKSPKFKLDDYKDFDSYYIERSDFFYFKKGEKLRQTNSRTIKILSQQGVSRFSTLEIEFDPFYERAYINKIIVKNEFGKTLHEGNRSDYYVTDLKDGSVDTKKLIHAPVANLAPGYTIEFVYSTESLNIVQEFPYSHIYHSASRPVESSLIGVVGDVDELLFNSKSTSKPTRTHGTLLWSHSNPVPYYNESMQVRTSTYLPSVVINQQKQDWKELADEYYLTIKPRLEPSDDVNILAKSLVAGKKTQASKVSAIVNYIQENITYKAIEFGVRGRMPNDALTTVNNRYGDCKDHAVLLQTMLTSVGVPSDLALVNLSENVEVRFPSLNQFDHMIVHLPDLNNGLFIDTTDKNMNLIETVPRGLTHSHALILKKSKSKMLQIGNASLNGNLFNSDKTITLSKSGKAIVSEVFTLEGYSGSSFKGFLKTIEPGKLFNWAHNFLAEQSRDINLITFKTKNVSNLNEPLIIELKYEVANITLDNSAIIFRDTSIWEHYYLIPDRIDQRKTDFSIKYPRIYKGSTILYLPSKYKVNINKLKNHSNKSKFASYQIDWKESDGVLSYKYTISEKGGSFSKLEYDDYYKFMKQFVELLSRSINITPSS